MNDGELICNLCYPDIFVYGEVLPNWVFAFQEEAEEAIPERHYALFNHFHEPCFIWPQRPVESTADKYGYEESETWADDDPRMIQEGCHVDNVMAMEEHFQCGVMTGYILVKACIDAGYDNQNSGMPLFWLVNRMARMIESFH